MISALLAKSTTPSKMSPESMISAGSSCERAPALHSLPDQQYGHSDRDVSRPPQEGHGKPEFRPHAEQRRESRVSGFLHAQRIGDENGGTPRSADETFDPDYHCEIDARPHQAKGDPCPDRACDPSGKMKRRGQSDTRTGPIDRVERTAHCRGGRNSAGQEPRGDLCGDPMAEALQSEK